ncbi:MAG: hypothetical protein RL223_196 [Pseudomonadota bacterium]
MPVLARPTTLPSNAQLTALLDGVDEVLLLLDARARLSVANRAAQRLLGCEPGQTLEQALGAATPSSRQAVLSWALGPPEAGRAAAAEGAPRWPLPEPGSLCHLELCDGLTLQFSLMPLPGGARALRAPLFGHAPQMPRLSHGVSAELVRQLWDSPLPVAVQGRDFVVRAANRAYFEIFGLQPAQVIGHDPIERVPAEDQPALRASRERLLRALEQGAQPDPMPERRMIDAQGRERWFRAMPRWISADDGTPLLLVTLQDVTWQHKAEQGDDDPGRELDPWFDLSPVGMLVYDSAGLVLRSNAAFEQMVGCAPVLLRDAPADVRRLLAWEDDRPHAELKPEAAPIEVRCIVQGTGGGRQRLAARLRAFDAPSPGAQGTPARKIMAVVEDRSHEDATDLARLEVCALQETAGLGVVSWRAAGGWQVARAPRSGSAAWPEFDGGVAAAPRAVDRAQVDPATHEDYDRLQLALRERVPAQARWSALRPDGGARWLRTRVEPGELPGGEAALTVVTQDVTELEDAQRRNEQLLRELSTILEASTAGIAYLRGEQLVRCNRRFETLLGLLPGRAAGAVLADLLPGQPAAVALLRQALVEQGRHEVELALPAVAGRPAQWLALSVGRAAGASAEDLVVLLTDITRQKQQQGELEALAHERELMFSLSDVGVAWVRQGRIERANVALARLTGYSVDELGHLHQAALYADDAAFHALWPQQQQALQATGHWSGEQRLRRRDGRLLWVQVSQRRVEGADGQPGVITSYVDVDERHRARDALQLQAERTRAILDSVLVGIVTVGDHGIEWMNRSARRMFGGELADFVGEPIGIVATADPDHPLRATHYLRALGDGQAETFECRLRGRDGREFYVVGNAVVTGRPGDGAVPGEVRPHSGNQITFALLDIERRRQAETSIAQAQASLQRIIETAPLAIALFDARTGRVLRLNQMAAAFFGRPVEAVLGHPPEVWFSLADADALRADLAQARRLEGHVLRREWRRSGRMPSAVARAAAGGWAAVDAGAPPSDAALREAASTLALHDALGSPVPLAALPAAAVAGQAAALGGVSAGLAGALSVALSGGMGGGMGGSIGTPTAAGGPTLEDEDDEASARVWDMRVVTLDDPSAGPEAGRDGQLLLVASDVTEQRAAEQARFEAAVQQREMLVKEVHHRIKNNLQGVAGLLQQTAARRPEVAGLITEAVSQVQAIAQVHGLQVGSHGPLQIQPLVEAILANVSRTFGRRIDLRLSGTPAQRFALPEAESIPIALTINELLTNAIKHGAPVAVDSAAVVHCELLCDEARLVVSIRNPGQLREGFSLAQVPTGVSGLGLVRALLPRRSATLTLTQIGVEVEARVVLVPPSILLLEPA